MSAFDLEFIGIVSFQFVLLPLVLWFAMRHGDGEDENQETEN
jgi:hypothetical protein